MFRPSAVWEFDSQTSSYADYTDSIRTNEPFSFLSGPGKIYYIGFDRRFVGIYSDLDAGGSYSSLVFEYQKDQFSWEKLELLDSYNFDISKYLRWQLPKFWIKYAFTESNPHNASPPDNFERYWIRISASDVSSISIINKIRIIPYATYTSAEKVSEFLQLKKDFDNNTKPSDLNIEDMIRRAEDRIDYRTRKSWRFNAVTEETSPILLDYNRYGFYPRHRNLIKVYSVSIWNGNSWQILTEGRNHDYFVNYDLGMIYFTRLFLLPAAYGMTGRYFHFGYGEYKNSVKIDYAYGRDPERDREFFIVEDIATKMVAKDFIKTSDYNVWVVSGTDKIPMEAKVRLLEEEIEMRLDELMGVAIV